MNFQCDYITGRCDICGEDNTLVRWKNIYLIGSEGINICNCCERELLEYLRKKRSSFFLLKKQERIKNVKKVQ